MTLLAHAGPGSHHPRSMSTPRVLVLCGCGLLTGCGEPPLAQDPAGRYRIVARIPVSDPIDRARDALAAHVAAHGPPGALFADCAAGAAAAAPGSPLIAIASPPADAAIDPLATFVVDETGAAIAVDMALLACAGIAVPARLPIGTHVLTSGNRAGGGAARTAAGDLIAGLLRRQHAEVLDPEARRDVVFRMGVLVFSGANGWHARVRDELALAARRYRHIDLVTRDAAGSIAQQTEIARALLDEGHRAIFVTTDDPETLGTIAGDARDRRVALVVLDRELRGSHATCCIGADQTVLGRAAGEALAALLRDGGTIVELCGEPRTGLLEQRVQGFRSALGMR